MKTDSHFFPITLFPNTLDSFQIKSIRYASSHEVNYEALDISLQKMCILQLLDAKYYNKSIFLQLDQLKKEEKILFLLPDYHSFSSSFAVLSFPYSTTLFQYLSNQTIHFSFVQQLLSQIGKSICILHNNNISHNNISLQSIFVCNSGSILLGNFSFSRRQSNLSFQKDLSDFIILLLHLLNPDYYDKPIEIKLNKNIPESFLLHNPFSNINQYLFEKLFLLSTEKNVSTKDLIDELLVIFQKYTDETLPLIYPSFTIQLSSYTQKAQKNYSIFHYFHSIKNKSKLPVAYIVLSFSFFLFLFTFYHTILFPKDINKKHENKMESSSTCFSSSPRYTNPVFNSQKKKQINSELHNKSSGSVSKNILDISNKSLSCVQLKKMLNPKLQILFAHNNKFNECKSIAISKNLEELYLSDNQIEKLDGIQLLANLKIIVLSKNKIKDVTPLSKLTNLTTLDLSHNTQLNHINKLQNLTHLRYLILTNTNINYKEINKLKKSLSLCTILY